LIAFYPFNGDALDASGNDNHATLVGAATVTTYLTIGSNAVDRARLPYTIFEGLGDFTVSAWGRVNTVHSPGDQTLLSGARGGQDNDVLVIYNSDNAQWGLAVNGSGPVFAPSADFSDQDWHHILVLRRGALARVYVDNVEIGSGLPITVVGTNLDPNGLIVGQDQDSVDGGYAANQSWAGDIDNLRIYNRALSTTEIRALYQETGWGD
jgi:MSHA biogenesis protein MshQ